MMSQVFYYISLEWLYVISNVILLFTVAALHHSMFFTVPNKTCSLLSQVFQNRYFRWLFMVPDVLLLFIWIALCHFRCSTAAHGVTFCHSKCFTAARSVAVCPPRHPTEIHWGGIVLQVYHHWSLWSFSIIWIIPVCHTYVPLSLTWLLCLVSVSHWCSLQLLCIFPVVQKLRNREDLYFLWCSVTAGIFLHWSRRPNFATWFGFVSCQVQHLVHLAGLCFLAGVSMSLPGVVPCHLRCPTAA